MEGREQHAQARPLARPGVDIYVEPIKVGRVRRHEEPDHGPTKHYRGPEGQAKLIQRHQAEDVSKDRNPRDQMRGAAEINGAAEKDPA